MHFEIENVPRKVVFYPLQEIDFPKTVYMVVDKNIELEIKLLKDYPEWEFFKWRLTEKNNRNILRFEVAKRACSKEQKVIKVPNTDVFRIVSPILISKRNIEDLSAEKLINQLWLLLIKLIFKRLPIIEPPIKLEPITKLTGNFTVSFFKKLTLVLLELFCIPIINNRNKQELKVLAKIIFFNINDIYFNFFWILF